MSSTRSIFGFDRVFLPVIHPINEKAAVRAVEVAVEAKADGVWLINQGMTWAEVLLLARKVREEHPSLWLGLNLLGFTAEGAFGKIAQAGLYTGDYAVHGLWSDQGTPLQSGLYYFGGVAFKYQAEVPPEAYHTAITVARRNGVNIITTSGPGTGEAAPVEKLRAFREILGPDEGLALASGVTPDNVDAYLPYVNAYLVATGIEERPGVLDPAKVKALAKKIHTP